ncbi:MAG: FtsX-like permease family protein [Betaproteobacteria bacterium]|nr:FtsX-like permease family protein [Betaproteobacteria bacterium]
MCAARAASRRSRPTTPRRWTVCLTSSVWFRRMAVALRCVSAATITPPTALAPPPITRPREAGICCRAIFSRTDALFTEGENPIGQSILIENVPFEVVGVMSSKGESAFGSDLDDNLFVPLTTGRMRLFGQSHVKAIALQLADMNQSEATVEAVEAILKRRHQTVDFKVRNMASLIETATETQDTLALLLGSIAAISLLVGGIGVMNIMLVSVTERIREIGIRMACGARRAQIQLQFSIEALLVCAIGGLIGVGLGFAAGYAARAFGSPVIFSAPPVLMAFGSAFIIGMVFGYLPARRAARLDPVMALASE